MEPKTVSSDAEDQEPAALPPPREINFVPGSLPFKGALFEIASLGLVYPLKAIPMFVPAGQEFVFDQDHHQ